MGWCVRGILSGVLFTRDAQGRILLRRKKQRALLSRDRQVDNSAYAGKQVNAPYGGWARYVVYLSLMRVKLFH